MRRSRLGGALGSTGCSGACILDAMDYLIARFFDKSSEYELFTRVITLEQTEFQLPFLVTNIKRRLPRQVDLMGEIEADGPLAFKTRSKAEEYIEHLVSKLPEDGFKERN
jgi:hypothetical protein